MKNILSFFVALLAVISVSAQDTLSRPPSYCAYYYWPNGGYDTARFYNPVGSWFDRNSPVDFVSGTILHKQYDVYGISVALHTAPYIMQNYGVLYDDYPWYEVLDTSTVCEKVRLYRKEGDSLYVEREAKWCYDEHPADWYLSTGYENIDTMYYWDHVVLGFWPGYTIVPMYDLYFDEPFPYYHPEEDTLYLGVATTSRIRLGSKVTRISTYPVYPMWLVIQDKDMNYFYTDISHRPYITNDSTSTHGYYPYHWANPPASMVIYPIVAPRPQPAGIQAVEDIEITLGPNPASDRVKVSSSAEITGIAVASIDGRSVYNKPHGGKTATLDIRTWPAGVYFVTVNTPFGSRVHKLLKM